MRNVQDKWAALKRGYMSSKNYRKMKEKHSVIIEITAAVVAVAFLIYFLRSMLLYGETTLMHDSIHGYPYFQYFVENIINASWPFWNPFSHGGEPFYFMIEHRRLLEPVTLLTIYLTQFFTHDAVLILGWNTLVLSIGMVTGIYILLRSYADNLFIRLTLIPILLYSSIFLCSFRQACFLLLFMWVPYIAYFLLRIVWKKDHRWHNWLILGCLIGLNWQSYYFVGVCIFLLFFSIGVAFFQRSLFVELLKTKSVLPKFIVAAVIILFMMAPNIVLLLEKDRLVFPARMMTSVDNGGTKKYQQAEYMSYEGKPSNLNKSIIMPYSVIARTGVFSKIWDFIQFISPDGNRHNLWPDRKWWGFPSEAYMYIGILPWAIAILGMVMGRHELKRVWFVILVGFGFLMLGPPGVLHKVLYYVYPPVWFIRHTCLFVLFFVFAVLFFYVLGLNYIFTTWRKPLLTVDNKGRFLKRSSVIAFSVCIVTSVYLVTRTENHLMVFPFICFVLGIGWILRKSAGRERLCAGLITSHIAVVAILTNNTLKFCIYTFIVFVIPLSLYLYIKERTDSSGKSKPAVMILFIVFMICLTGDLLYSFKQSRQLYLSQMHPGLAYNIKTKTQKPFLPHKRLILPDPISCTTGQSMRMPSLAYRQPYVFSPLFVGEVASANSFEDALKSKRWNSLLMLRNYLMLINSGISPLAIQEMFAVGKTMFQFKRGAVLADDDEAYIFLKGLDADGSVQLLQDYVLVDGQSGQSLSDSGVLVKGCENFTKASLEMQKIVPDVIKKETFTYTDRQDKFIMSENYCSSSLNIEAISMSEQRGPLSLCDGDSETFWHVKKFVKPAWIKIDFGEGNKKVVNYLMAKPRSGNPAQFFANAILDGSNDNKNWESVAAISHAISPETNKWASWSFPNEKPYRYYRMSMLDGHTGGRFYSFAELGMYNRDYRVIMDLGKGNEKVVNYMKVKLDRVIHYDDIDIHKGFCVIKGSNNSGSWQEIATLSCEEAFEANKWLSWYFPNEKPYRYYKLSILDGHTSERFCFSDYGELKMERTAIKQSSYNAVDMKVSTNQKGILYWADGYDKWWNAYVNGKEVPVYRANINFKAISLPKGTSTIRFVYNPILFKIGILIFYGTLILSIVWQLVMIIYNKYRPLGGKNLKMNLFSRTHK